MGDVTKNDKKVQSQHAKEMLKRMIQTYGKSQVTDEDAVHTSVHWWFIHS